MDAFIGEIRAFSFTYVPVGWKACDGTEYPIQQFQALFAVIGNTYGGKTQQTFKVPDLRTLAAAGTGTGPGLTPRNLGATFGTASQTLTASQIANHDHTLTMQNPVGTSAQANTLSTPVANSSWLARVLNVTGPTSSTAVPAYTKPGTATFDAVLHPNTIGVSGAGGAHENRQPYLAIQYCICFDGVFPAWN